MTADRAAKVARAWALRDEGRSLFAIASELGVTKEWLRAYAGLADGRPARARRFRTSYGWSGGGR